MRMILNPDTYCQAQYTSKMGKKLIEAIIMREFKDSLISLSLTVKLIVIPYIPADA